MRKAMDVAQWILGSLAMVLFLAGGLLHVPWLMTAGWVVLALMWLVFAYWVVRLLLRLRWMRRVSRVAARQAARRRMAQRFAGWEPK